VTPVTTGPLRIDADGNLTLAPNTVSGTYTITYQLCEEGADPCNCTNATANVVVLNPIDAVDDNPVAVNTGVNPKVVFVYDNDSGARKSAQRHRQLSLSLKAKLHCPIRQLNLN
jgi:hypothetical protein